MNEIEIYKDKKNQTQIEVKFQEKTVWLTQAQISVLFKRERTVITKHINNVFKEGELDKKVVCANFAHTTKHGAIKGKTQEKTAAYYNLDVIISVGYRVKSKQGTQFRQWATQRLKDYLVKGYAINEKRLNETQAQFKELKQAVALLEKVSRAKELSGNEAQGLLKVLNDFTVALDILDQYDHQTLKIRKSKSKEVYRIAYKEAKKAIEELKKKFGGSALFGNEKDKSLKAP